MKCYVAHRAVVVRGAIWMDGEGFRALEPLDPPVGAVHLLFCLLWTNKGAFIACTHAVSAAS